MITLAIDTSTPQGSVALLHDHELVFTETFMSGRSHSSQLFEVLQRALAGKPALDQIAVGLGPGSYAGVRIAISAAVGLGVATGAELLGVPSIVTLADGDYLALGDARRETFYFSRVSDGACLEGPLLMTAAELQAKLSQAGDLPLMVSEALAILPAAQLRYPCAERLARLAAAGQSIVARGALEPIYLRDPHITLPRAF